MHRIMIVDDNEDMLTIYRRVLKNEGFEVHTATSGDECLEQLATVRPDIFLLDVMLPDCNGIDLVKQIKSQPAFANSFVVLLSGLITDSSSKITGLEAGALDYLARPISNKELVARMKSLVSILNFQESLENISKGFETLSITDGLTGISNRRHFDQVLSLEFSRHARSGKELSLIMLDIDHFKLFNDHYGHVQGDKCLQQISQVLNAGATRPSDLIARYGGEEFVCILPETGLQGALRIAEKIRNGIGELHIPHAWSEVTPYVTASLGVVSLNGNALVTVSEIIALADELMYRAKSRGRNRIECNEALASDEAG